MRNTSNSVVKSFPRPRPMKKAAKDYAVAASPSSEEVRNFGGRLFIGGTISISVILLAVASIILRVDSPRAAEISLPPVIEPVNLIMKQKPAVVPKVPELPQGVITVPEVKLRSMHSFYAKALDGHLRRGERVSILRSFSPEHGPSWVHVRSRARQTGWILASVVQQKKSRR